MKNMFLTAMLLAFASSMVTAEETVQYLRRLTLEEIAAATVVPSTDYDESQEKDPDVLRLLSLRKLVGGDSGYEIIENLFKRARPVGDGMEFFQMPIEKNSNPCKRSRAQLWLSGRTVYSSAPFKAHPAIFVARNNVGTPIANYVDPGMPSQSYPYNPPAPEMYDMYNVQTYVEDSFYEELNALDDPLPYMDRKDYNAMQGTENLPTRYSYVNSMYELINKKIGGVFNYWWLNYFQDKKASWGKPKVAVVDNYVLFKMELSSGETVYGYFFNNVTPCRKTFTNKQGKKQNSSALFFTY